MTRTKPAIGSAWWRMGGIWCAVLLLASGIAASAGNTLEIESVEACPDDASVTVAIHVGVDSDLSLVNLHIGFDGERLQLSETQITPETTRLYDGGATPTVVSIDDGMVKWTLGGAKGTRAVHSGGGPLLYLTFDLVPDCPEGTIPLRWKRADAFDSQLNELAFSVQSDGAIEVKAAAIYTVVYEAAAHGFISGESPQAVPHGEDTAPVDAIPELGYRFTGWSDGRTDNPRTDVGVTTDIHVLARFVAETLEVAFEAGPHGSVLGTTSQTVRYGDDAEAVTAVPDKARAFSRWLLDGLEYSTDNPLVVYHVTETMTLTAEFVPRPHDADQNGDWQIDTSPELSRLVQFINSGGYHCEEGTEDGYAPGPGDQSCRPHDADQNGDWQIDLSPELSRIIQFVNSGGYHCDPTTEDGYAPGPAPTGEGSEE